MLVLHQMPKDDEMCIRDRYMIVAIDYDGKGDESPSVYIIKRNADGTFDDRSDIQLIAAYKQCKMCIRDRQ